ncbi:hypothetical protein [Streptomyces sp. BF23-18]|uniref:hypothetical protein n=1 Tax=unclassified Streptomyces TaxID=2593676 RepID=UPI0034E487E7
MLLQSDSCSLNRQPPLRRQTILMGCCRKRLKMGTRSCGLPGVSFCALRTPDPSGEIPAGQVLIYDWGCTIWSLVDFADPAGGMWCTHDGAHWPQGITLVEWLAGTVTGTLELDELPETQPARQVDGPSAPDRWFPVDAAAFDLVTPSSRHQPSN